MAANEWTEHERLVWNRLTDYLRQQAPCDKRVHVSRTRVPKSKFAVVADLGNRYYIRIDRGRSFADAVYDLSEEWAHCRIGITGDHNTDHRAAVGAEDYAIRRLIDEFLATCQEE